MMTRGTALASAAGERLTEESEFAELGGHTALAVKQGTKRRVSGWERSGEVRAGGVLLGLDRARAGHSEEEVEEVAFAGALERLRWPGPCRDEWRCVPGGGQVGGPVAPRWGNPPGLCFSWGLQFGGEVKGGSGIQHWQTALALILKRPFRMLWRVTEAPGPRSAVWRGRVGARGHCLTSLPREPLLLQEVHP